MKTILAITTAFLLGTTAATFAQTTGQPQSQQNLMTSPSSTNPGRASARRPAATIERETTGMGLREPDVPFLFSPGAKDPQRNDPTTTPFGPMNNIE